MASNIRKLCHFCLYWFETWWEILIFVPRFILIGIASGIQILQNVTCCLCSSLDLHCWEISPPNFKISKIIFPSLIISKISSQVFTIFAILLLTALKVTNTFLFLFLCIWFKNWSEMLFLMTSKIPKLVECWLQLPLLRIFF